MGRLRLPALIVAAITALSVLAPVRADGGPHVDQNIATSDVCATCHRTHRGIGRKLLVSTSPSALCRTCHGSAGAGANTNVDDGRYLSSRDDNPPGVDGDIGAANTPDNGNLLAGGFFVYKGFPTTSTHPLGASAAWGNGPLRGVKYALGFTLSCVSCHDPHGSPNYRIIKETVNGNAVTATQVDEGPAKDYDTEQWGSGMSTICRACHIAYHTTTPGSGSDPAVKATGGTFSHRVDMSFSYAANQNPETVGLGGVTLPLAESGSNDTVVCSTCHLVHGTSAGMTGFAPNAGPAANSSLLRLPNRGVCEVCHQK